MNKRFKTLNTYPAGTIVLTGKRSIWDRLFNRNTEKIDSCYILPTEAYITITKKDLRNNNYIIYSPIKPYNNKEQNKLYKITSKEDDILLNELSTILNIIRPNTIFRLPDESAVEYLNQTIFYRRELSKMKDNVELEKN